MALLNNEVLARKRLYKSSCRLSRDVSLCDQYQGVLADMETAGVTEEVPESEISGQYPLYHMSHHPVVRESNTTTLLRPVIGALAKDYNGVSLNDCLETRPNMTLNLIDILMLFCRWLIVLIADISQTFLQIKFQCSAHDVRWFFGKMKVLSEL